jgi:hypothetical protein
VSLGRLTPTLDVYDSRPALRPRNPDVGLLILILLALLVVGALPHWPYSRQEYGYYPAGGLTLVFVVVLLLLLFGAIPWGRW